jgi:hypothetical protein
MTCAVCGRPDPGPVPPDSLAAIAAPRMRPTIVDGKWEPLCLRCLWSAALTAKVIG